MNKYFWYGLLSGVLIGSGVTYIVMKTLKPREYEDYDEFESYDEEAEVRKDEGSNEPSISNKDYIKNSRIINYKGYYKMGDIKEVTPPEYPTEEELSEDGMDEEEDDAEFEYELDESPSEGARDKPYMITSDEYNNGAPYFDKETLYYYEGDNTIVDDYDDVFDDRDKFLGDFTNGFDEDEENRCFVRNEVIGCDYEIVRYEGKYYNEEADE